MARLIDNLELVARGEIARLKRLCQVDDEDFADMLRELRGYDPKPGLRFGSGPAEAVVPDILVRGGDRARTALKVRTSPSIRQRCPGWWSTGATMSKCATPASPRTPRPGWASGWPMPTGC